MISNSLIKIIELSMLAVLAGQFGYAFAILILGKAQVEYFESGIFNHSNNIFHKIINFILYSIVGLGPFLYYKSQKDSWILSKFLYILYFIIAGIVAIILFNAVSQTLKFFS
ncbi:hypothetical protein CEF21_21295 [Bacillus sp. FJAT-42376]|uniref:hypothetical protein n=1 Tax=Bacillus sp. FJAT-42376 TaxID=2014076 RepID=UPI000F5004AE|nr:hypothetical protein [Bacillus sp. FJAT-42376]AZB44618.1 hypothetical protein CEF21_21295 [Bacillus sp. FJAT-42376]